MLGTKQLARSEYKWKSKRSAFIDAALDDYYRWSHEVMGLLISHLSAIFVYQMM